MTVKQNSSAPSRSADDAGEVFRQFAWHLAGSIVAAGGKAAGRPSKSTRRASSGKR